MCVDVTLLRSLPDIPKIVLSGGCRRAVSVGGKRENGCVTETVSAAADRLLS
jgi:hypothetical protein